MYALTIVGKGSLFDVQWFLVTTIVLSLTIKEKERGGGIKGEKEREGGENKLGRWWEEEEEKWKGGER